MNKRIIMGLLGLLIPVFGLAQTDTVSFFVDGICGMCEDRIESAVLKARGVETAAWDVDSRQLTLTVNPEKYNERKTHQRIAYAGHDTELITATDAAYDNLHSCCKYRDTEVINAHQPKEKPSQVSIYVNGACGMCRDRIQQAALQSPGVNLANWDVDTRQLTVYVDPEVFTEDQLHWAMIAIGHDTEAWLASDATYENLPDCCQYRELAEPFPPAPTEDTGDAEPLLEASGRIMEIRKEGAAEPLVGVNVFWADTRTGTTTDADGTFVLERDTENEMLVVSYIGYAPDTIDMRGEAAVEITLSEAVMLDEVEVSYRERATDISFTDPIKTLQINEGELLKAACCNLSESFETNPSVDVSFTDAVTGTRQIQMLGLAGPYVQITQELLPGVRGLSVIQGMSYVPGPWISGIQLIKGPGSVVQGFESMTGQINVNLKQPENSERLYLNLYANEGGRLEGNLNTAIKLNDKVSTGILLHGNLQRVMNDRNQDGFLDNTVGDDLIAVNRWKFRGNNGWVGQVGAKLTLFNRAGGQMSDSYAEQVNPQNPLWTSLQQTDRLEVWAKTGVVFPERPYASIGLQFSGVIHDQTSSFGYPQQNERDYYAEQRSGYFNFIYQSIIGSTAHQFKTGMSVQADQVGEGFVSEELMTDYTEVVPGAYFEYTFLPSDNFTAVLGLRGDYSTLYGAFATPRAHLRWAANDYTVFRASAGRGQRRPFIYMEQIGAFASNRSFILRNREEPGPRPEIPYGLDPEVSWNFGLNLTQGIPLGTREVLLSIDAYHTLFESQIVADYDQDPQQLVFYNLEGRSFSNSIQTQIDYELLPRWDVRLAYRFNDVQMTFDDGLREKPFVSAHRAFINTAYETRDGWAFDLTVNWRGSQRIPDTQDNPVEYQLEDRAPAFTMVNTQVSKSWNGIFDIYLGAENLFNFVQENPILAADDPASPFFDASLVWGPIFGRMIYTGIRYRFE